VFVRQALPSFLRASDDLSGAIAPGASHLGYPGFREYYNPFTGEGMGARGFTWGGLVLDME